MNTGYSTTPAPTHKTPILAGLFVLAFLLTPALSPVHASDQIDFNRDIRRVLSENCFKCHGPDPKERKGPKHGQGLRLDTPEGALADLGGHAAIVPGQPQTSELYRRINTSDPDDQMPPPDSGKKLTHHEIELLRQWIEQGAPYARHWSYLKPKRHPLPPISNPSWLRNAIDHFILARLEREGLAPSPEADPYSLIRRLSLDLTGLPPTLAEVDQFVNDRDSSAYERLVDRLLAKEAFGEHWARMWLDQARYADSSGYADDPLRTIWAYRDYVIRSFNANKPFDKFTIEQIAGDLLSNPTDEQLVATAFHRNTLTNNEGGTNDEEFRNVAVVDRVNTTMSVWMGTTMGCAQCHDHKYDPISQEDYFRLFAILNNTQDADRGDESPLLPLFSEDQKRQKSQLSQEIAHLKELLQTPTPELTQAEAEWAKTFTSDLPWLPLKPQTLNSLSQSTLTQDPDGTLHATRKGRTDVYTLETLLPNDTSISALRLDTLPDDSLPNNGPGHAKGNFVVSRLLATLHPPEGTRLSGRFLHIEIPGKEKILSLAEVQLFNGPDNIAPQGHARQSSTAYEGPAHLAIDGNTDGDYAAAKSTTHSEISEDPWWELDLKSTQPVDRVVLWNRTDNQLQGRLSDFQLTLLDEAREPVWTRQIKKAPNPDSEFPVNGPRAIPFSAAFADYSQPGFNAADLLGNQDVKNKGWAIDGQTGQAHQLTLVPTAPVDAPAGSRLTVTIEQLSKRQYHTLGKFRLSTTADPRASQYAPTPPPILAILKTTPGQRTDPQRDQLQQYYLTIAPTLQPQRNQLAQLEDQLNAIKPYTTVPVLRELTGDKRRPTHIQRRGNFLDQGNEVSEGLPPAFLTLPDDTHPNRRTLANWLISPDNPLTPRVVANRFWESLFGIGIVPTSEEFGTQGDPPSHPKLLDWLATELVDHHWNTKHLIKLMVTSATYRQSSRVTPDLLATDLDNRLLARGPRFRLSAEMIRDQAMAVSGLLSPKLYGPPVKPLQPKVGLSAAFGSGIDWKTSEGEDRYRRGIYTTWRRSNPYPSMATFDAPNREVCTVRRDRTNTPLQALVTLNDPVYVEAAQSLARRIVSAASTEDDQARYGFRLCLARLPTDQELSSLTQLYRKARARFAQDPETAGLTATEPIGPAPEGANLAELAAWTVVGNVLLNLDEFLMKR